MNHMNQLVYSRVINKEGQNGNLDECGIMIDPWNKIIKISYESFKKRGLLYWCIAECRAEGALSSWKWLNFHSNTCASGSTPQTLLLPLCSLWYCHKYHNYYIYSLLSLLLGHFLVTKTIVLFVFPSIQTNLCVENYLKILNSH